MKFLPTQLIIFLQSEPDRRNLRLLFRFLVVVLVLVLVFTVIFHLLMLREGQRYFLITGFYWTLTVMSTLGFGDIIFHSDAGRFPPLWYSNWRSLCGAITIRYYSGRETLFSVSQPAYLFCPGSIKRLNNISIK
ncbi:ion channel [Pontibacter brevis]